MGNFHPALTAAFANTFGGLLFVGIMETEGRPEEIIGIKREGRKEQKTRIASSISSRISPTPSFEIQEFPLDDGGSRVYLLIRVWERPFIHMLLKGDKPVYVRTEDRNSPANAAQLRAMIERDRSVSVVQPSPETEPLTLYVTQAKALPGKGLGDLKERMTERENSPTNIRVSLSPVTPVPITLDQASENSIVRIVRNSNPDLAQRQTSAPKLAMWDIARRREWTQVGFTDFERDVEMYWRVTTQGVVLFVSQVVHKTDSYKRLWSLPDLFIVVGRCIACASAIWYEASYYGEANFRAKLVVGDAEVAEDSFVHQSIYYPVGPIIPSGTLRNLPTRIVTTREVARADERLTYAARFQSPEASVASIVMQLIRDLGYVAYLEDFVRFARPRCDASE